MREKRGHCPHREVRLLGFAVLPLLLGLVFFAASLTPSLIPRHWLFQGVLAGLVTGVGYMLGQLFLSAWRAIELPLLRGKAARVAHSLVAIPVLALWVWDVSQASKWQDTIRLRVGMDPSEDYRTLGMLGLAVAVFLFCFLIGWMVQELFDILRSRLYRVMPARTANVLGLMLAVSVVFVVTRDGIVAWAFDAADESYEAAQDLFATAPPAPDDPDTAGGPGSFVDWAAMGQPGRNFVTQGPTAADISALSGAPALDPIRVYVGRAQDDDPEVRAQIALEELKRLGAFDRKVLIVASPTGTGWLDPGGHDPIEYLHNGDIATVAVQYSYLQSPLALIFETASGLDQATDTMRVIYQHWRSLPVDDRPQFYVHGISLGAWSSMYSFDLFQLIDDPIQGALWTGPPFPSNLWRRMVAARDQGSPYVLPQVGDGSLVRFMSQFDGPNLDNDDWGRLRIVFMQQGSDPIVFYEPSSVWRAPQWMREPPAPDVSPAMRFVPVVTQFQLALDLALSKALPQGYGHNYIARDYIDGWIAVTAPEGWTAEQTKRLKTWCSLDWGLGCRK
ncbi:alpha/beta hydrolase [Qingshengfaniella alkalisoli]|uniref:alpha/beta hydrolase n=1 Tax=Qingshengfaniella alkalisoli TaxID=2599296 RepID=UPI001F0F686C|nr:alpha/beta-hydrolase family protein [Qingshengfaniella alkalisoli]